MLDRAGQCWFFDNMSPHPGGTDSVLLFIDLVDEMKDIDGRPRWRCLRTLPGGRLCINFYDEMNPLEQDQSWDRIDCVM